MKSIQVFLKGESSCEISGLLHKIVHQNGWTFVFYREEPKRKVYETQFPDVSISMIRLFDEEEDS